MSAELIAIVAFGVALGGGADLIRTGSIRSADMIDEQLARVEQRVARLKGLTEGAGLYRSAEWSEPTAGD